ncbi:WhiB family transcriptional regulator [Actinosynnema sp. NPDC047251]|nr:WhiB family transcriptional regulator [Saccharothrix espanaensis]
MLALFGTSGQPSGWRTSAACGGQDTELFFDASHPERAAEVCGGCPVREQCRTDQLAWERHGSAARRYSPAGFVGGLTGRERKAIHYPRSAARDE